MLSLSFVPFLAPVKGRSRCKMVCGNAPATTPVLISDVLSTLVVDPFFNGMHKYFGFDSFDDFVRAKTPGVWLQFEKGQIDEKELAENFFLDKRPVNLSDFKEYLKGSYALLPGVGPMLTALQDAHVEVHLCTNYPIWADLIEDTLQLRPNFGVRWTYVSGREGIRKPAVAAFHRVAQKANAPPSSCVLLDDSQSNCEGALNSGYLAAIHFQDAVQASNQIREVFRSRNVHINFERNK